MMGMHDILSIKGPKRLLSMPRPIKRLDDLAPLKRRLAESVQERLESSRVAQRHATAVQQQQDEFRNAIGAVAPLKAQVRHQPKMAELPAVPKQRLADDQAVMREAVSYDIDVESLLDTDEALSWRRRGTGTDVLRKLRRGDWTVQAEVDLHGLRVDGARTEIGLFLREANRRGLRCIRVIHGKGLGSPAGVPILKGKVRSWLLQRDDVIAFCQARPAQGGAGALIVLLAPTPPIVADR